MDGDSQPEQSEQSKLSELREYVESLQDSNPAVGACRRLSDDVSEWCGECLGMDSVTVVQGRFRGDNGVAQHFYVQIESSGQALIVDPTIRQFTYENWVDGKADTYIPESEIPDIGIIDESMDVFDRYE